MTEYLASTSPNRLSHVDPSAADTDRYLESLGDARTARHASEGFSRSPNPDDVTRAVRAIRTDIRPSFHAPLEELESNSSHDLVAMKEAYWLKAQRVGTEHGARPGYELEDYLTIGPDRSYEDIKERIEAEYAEGSVPRSVLEGIDVYHNVLQINPAHAATIVMEMIGRHLSTIKHLARTLRESGDVQPQDATAIAFDRFITTEIPRHINAIIEKYGYGDDAIRPIMNKTSFYPVDERDEVDNAALRLRENDAVGLVEVYDIQSRPFDRTSLEMGNEIAHIAEMQVAMIRIQETLIETSKQYLLAHPERASGNLENFSEIFVPEVVDGDMELLPNPKLLRAMVNNVMPGIAISIMRRRGSLDSLNEEDIAEGVRLAAKEYRLFQSRIGQFNSYDETTGTVELQSTFQVVCPANSLFPDYLSAHLAQYYEDAKTTSVN